MAFNLGGLKPDLPAPSTITAVVKDAMPIVAGVATAEIGNAVVAQTDASSSSPSQQPSPPGTSTQSSTLDYAGVVAATTAAAVLPLAFAGLENIAVAGTAGSLLAMETPLASPTVSGEQTTPVVPGQAATAAKTQSAVQTTQATNARLMSAITEPARATTATSLVNMTLAEEHNLPAVRTAAKAPAPASAAEPDSAAKPQQVVSTKSQQLTVAKESSAPEPAHAADVSFAAKPVPSALDRKMAQALKLDPSQLASLSVLAPANYAMLAAKFDKFVRTPGAAHYDRNGALSPASLQAFKRDAGVNIALSQLPPPPSPAATAAVPGGPGVNPPGHEDDPGKDPKMAAADGPKGKQGSHRVVHNEIKAHHSSNGTNFTVVTRNQDNPDHSHEVKFTEAHSMPDYKPGRNRQLPSTAHRNDHKSMVATAVDPGPGGPAKAPQQQMASNSPSVSHGGTIGFMGPLTAGIKNPGMGMT